MSEVQLKRLLANRNSARRVIEMLVEAIAEPVAIMDSQGEILLGPVIPDNQPKYPVESDDELLGWIAGSTRAAGIAAALAYFAAREAEKKILARETLDRYRELNTLYELSAKLAACENLKDMARLTLQETQRLINATDGAVLLQDEASHTVEVIASFGAAVDESGRFPVDRGLFGLLPLPEKEGILDHLENLEKAGKTAQELRSVIYCPLKADQQVIGLVALASRQPEVYTAPDLKLLAALASLAAPILEHALIYENRLKEALEREERLKARLLDLQIEQGEAQALVQNALAMIPLFDFLTPAERELLAGIAKPYSYPDGWQIYDPEGEGGEEYDGLFILYKGRLRVSAASERGGEVISIQAPAFFGENTVFFHQPPGPHWVEGFALGFMIPGEQVRAFVAANSMFRQAFATALRTKHRIFHGYDAFVNLLFSRAEIGTVQLQELVPAYRDLHPILHHGSDDEALDLDALAYILPRLPENITSAQTLLLVEHLQDIYQDVCNLMQVPTRRAKKRKFYEILPNKILVLLRDRMTDTVDLITKLCIYAIETGKLWSRLQESRVSARLVQCAMQSARNSTPEGDREAEALLAALPFSPEETSRLSLLFRGSLPYKLHEIIGQMGELTIHFQKGDSRYTISSYERWLGQIRDEIARVVETGSVEAGFNVHIIASNTHSIRNCLSPWLHSRADEILKWAEDFAPESMAFENRADCLYYALRPWLNSHPELVAQRAAADRANGIYDIEDRSGTGIHASLIEPDCRDGPVDPQLGIPYLEKGTLILNIDYAYGQQAELILRNLILLFGKQIRSISIFGKAGAVVGKRGDLLLPDRLLMQSDDQLYPIFNPDLSPTDFAALGYRRGVHEGTMITVLGTVMQSREMLYYYRHFWNAIGMEMEGSFYMREIQRARSLGLIDKDVRLRFAYYTSDTPLQENESLASNLRATDGLPSVYAITRAVLRRLFTSEES
jgi:uncharacterized protein YigA (DUF484 family)